MHITQKPCGMTTLREPQSPVASGPPQRTQSPNILIGEESRFKMVMHLSNGRCTSRFALPDVGSSINILSQSITEVMFRDKELYLLDAGRHGLLHDVLWDVYVVNDHSKQAELVRFIRHNEQNLLESYPAFKVNIRSFLHTVNNQPMCSLPVAQLKIECLSRWLHHGCPPGNQPSSTYEVDCLYQYLLSQIPKNLCSFADILLVLLLWTRRPLHIEELRAAIGISAACPLIRRLRAFSQEADPSRLQDFIREYYGRLLILHADGTVCLANSSFRDYLLKAHGQSVGFQKGQELLSLICLRTLTWASRCSRTGGRLSDLPTDFYSSQSCFGILQYARANWAHHSRIAEVRSYYIVQALQEYLQESFTKDSSRQRLDKDAPRSLNGFEIRDNLLRESARHGFCEMLKIYLEMGADANAESGEGKENALFLTMSNGHWTTAAKLLEYCAPTRYVSAAEETNFLHRASACGRIDIVAKLLVAGFDIDQRSSLCAETSLHWAAVSDQTAVVQLLLQAGSDPDARMSPTEETPLHLAAFFGCDETVRCLLGFSDIMAKDSNDWTALHFAAASGHAVIVRMLIECGAETRVKTSSSMTALDLATKYGHEDTATLILAQTIAQYHLE